jgi:hypothetical protein
MDRWDDYKALHREVFGKEPESSRQWVVRTSGEQC